jgi:hypothetical protein
MPKFATVAIDSVGELARLFFSKDMGKGANDREKIRAMQNYPGATERLNMLCRSLKQKRDKGVEIVFTAHEDIEKVYARGGAMAGKGQAPPDPVAVKGWPDVPGKRAPDEFCRACDNVLRVRRVNNSPAWIAARESIGVGADYWEVKDRFNGPAVRAGLLPANYEELKKSICAVNPGWWRAPYLWMLYGPYGIGKTRSLLSFPKPIFVIDLDKGTKSITEEEAKSAQMTIDQSIDVEESAHYDRFFGILEAAF